MGGPGPGPRGAAGGHRAARGAATALRYADQWLGGGGGVNRSAAKLIEEGVACCESDWAVARFFGRSHHRSFGFPPFGWSAMRSAISPGSDVSFDSLDRPNRLSHRSAIPDNQNSSFKTTVRGGVCRRRGSKTTALRWPTARGRCGFIWQKSSAFYVSFWLFFSPSFLTILRRAETAQTSAATLLSLRKCWVFCMCQVNQFDF